MANPIGQIDYSLDAAGLITERSIQGAGTTRYAYDAAGRMSRVIAPDGKETRYSYDPAGRLTTTERDLEPAGGNAQTLVTHQRHDAADRLVAIAHVKRAGTSEALVAGQALTRAAGGAIQKIDTYREGSSFDATTGAFTGTPSTSQVFEYDGNARLTRETRTRAGTATSVTTDTRYTYDAAGNRTGKSVTTPAGTEITTYSYDAADRLTQESTSLAAGGTRSTTYTWDGNGNLQSKTEPGRATLYRFDPQNRLIDIRTGATNAEAQAAAPSVRYSYDASGNRVRKDTPQGSTGYLIDPTHTYAQVALEKTSNGATSYVHGLQLIRQGNLLPLHGHLGTSLGAVDTTGNLQEQTDADAFGNFDQATGLKQTHLYTGEYWDQDAQLLYLRARWYEPRTGRFVSADPFEGKPTEPRSLNRYAYGHNDSVHVVDPTGHFGIVASPVISTGIQLGGRVAAGAAGRGILVRIAAQLVRVGVKSANLVKVLTDACAMGAGMNNRDCMGELPTFFLGDDYQGHTNFVALAQSATSPAILRRTPRVRGAWYINTPECNGRTGGQTGMDCDEYPYAMSAEGGLEGYREGIVALEPVSIGDNRGAGGKLRAFYNNPNCPIPRSGDAKARFLVQPVPGLPTTFWTCAR